MFADKILKFYENLSLPVNLPGEIKVLAPFKDPVTFELMCSYYKKFYSSLYERTAIFGINPGRFGAGLTGIMFTDPVSLEENCGIKNTLPKRKELSSEFIYDVIDGFGGKIVFSEKFYLGAVCPVGFTKNGVNYNFYDDKTTAKLLEGFIIEAVRAQIECGCSKERCILLGTGKNAAYFNDLNSREKFFKVVAAIEHPRFIMQYKRKQKDEFVDKYLQLLG
ncbi:MAG: DUF4918 family protein [Ignavibacteriaceae bacterium]|nr:DUF4918 family protein [Ignavibacteriaceae bacterium]